MNREVKLRYRLQIVFNEAPVRKLGMGGAGNSWTRRASAPAFASNADSARAVSGSCFRQISRL